MIYERADLGMDMVATVMAMDTAIGIQKNQQLGVTTVNNQIWRCIKIES